jgi:hypothetical protein
VPQAWRIGVIGEDLELLDCMGLDVEKRGIELNFPHRPMLAIVRTWSAQDTGDIGGAALINAQFKLMAQVL